MMDRRQFGTCAIVMSSGAAALRQRSSAAEPTQVKIDRIELFPVQYPLTGYFKFFVNAKGTSGRAAVLIKITADNGVVGWGQSVPIARWSYETWETATLALRHYYTPALIGRDPTDIPGALQAMDEVIAAGFTTGMPITRAGIDLALHDLQGHLRNQSLAAMWGCTSVSPITLSWTVNVTDLSDVERLMAEGKERGYRDFNIKVAPNIRFDVELAMLVRKAAPDGFLWADANGGYDRSSALDAARQLAAAGVDVLEAPLRPNQVSGYIALRKLGALPILMDEGVVSPVELEEFHKLGMLDGVAIKAARCGGLWTCRTQIEYCQHHGLQWLGSGLTDPDVSLAAALHLYAAYGLTRPAALNGPQFLTAQVLQQPIRIERNQAFAPEGPGLGIEVDEGKVVELMRRSGGDMLLR